MSLFNDPERVASLLRDVGPERFVAELDFSTLERRFGSYVSDDLRERHDDMAVRVLTYTALLWQDLIRTGRVKEGEPLPPVFPLVIYNGGARWTAAQDAAGLAIRELMRADTAALGQGARNANDAISLIQTADGALAIIDEKLIRMKELAEQAAIGTYDSIQCLIIDNEFQQMALEIDRIANSTEFNGVKLLDGSLSGHHVGSGAGSADAVTGDGTAIWRWEGTLADSGIQIPTLMDGGEYTPQKLSMPWNSGADASGSWTRKPMMKPRWIFLSACPNTRE